MASAPPLPAGGEGAALRRGASGAQAYNRHLANRVRGMRAQRGVSRKLLAQHAGVSERYLAQIEQGQANLSIALLWQIAQALDTDPLTLLSEEASATDNATLLQAFIAQLDEAQQQEAFALLRERFGAARDAQQGIALLGLRGAGKTTLGRLLARRTGLPFVQLTDVIERIGNMAVEEIFSLGGQPMYRRLEKQAVACVRGDYRNVILETGGSLVSAADTYSLLRRHFVTVWVRALPEEHMQRVIAQGDLRPMAGNTSAMEDLQQILQEREPLYRAADHVLETSARSVDDCIEELARLVPPHR